MKILHLSHTDIATDSRILKELKSLNKVASDILGIGIDLNEGARKPESSLGFSIFSLKLRARHFTVLPSTLRHISILVEFFIKAIVKSIRFSPDVIHCHDTVALPLGIFVKFATGGRLIYDAHELESDRNGLSKFHGSLTLAVEKLLWNWVDGFVTVSPSIEKWYLDTVGVKVSRVVLNSPACELNTVYDNNYLRRRFDIPSDKAICIYVGIMGKGRGIDIIVDAFSHREVDSHVVFLGYGELADDLRQMELAHDNFHVHPAVSHTDVVPIVKSADYGLCLIQEVSLSDYYSLPNKLFEYLFAGVPVIASDFPDIRAVLEVHEAGVCCKLDAGALVTTLKYLQDRPPSFTFSRLKEITWQAQEEKLLDLYQQLS